MEHRKVKEMLNAGVDNESSDDQAARRSLVRRLHQPLNEITTLILPT